MKKQITLRIDENVLEWFKSGGKGYQGRMNDALRKHMRFNTPHKDVKEFYEDTELDAAMGNASWQKRKPFAYDSVNNRMDYFKPMPKTGKKKK